MVIQFDGEKSVIDIHADGHILHKNLYSFSQTLDIPELSSTVPGLLMCVHSSRIRTICLRRTNKQSEAATYSALVKIRKCTGQHGQTVRVGKRIAFLLGGCLLTYS